ncbi:MAG: hypothetical protein AB7H48_04890 [Parachlamydiales bacterium]
MRIDIFENRYSNLSSSEAATLHNSLFKNYMHFEKLRTKKEIFPIKYLGFFLGLSFLFWILNGKTFSPFYLFGVVCIGFGCLFNYFLNMRLLYDYDREVSHTEREGEKLEEKCSQAIDFKPFSRSKELKNLRYKGALFERLFPFTIISILTGIAAALLVSPIAKWMSVAVIMISPIVTVLLNVKLMRSIKAAIFPS